MAWTWIVCHTDCGTAELRLEVADRKLEIGGRGRALHWFRPGANRAICGRADRRRMEFITDAIAGRATPCCYCLAKLGRMPSAARAEKEG